MRTEQEISADIAAASGDNKKLNALRAEMGALFSEGAKPCPICKNTPHGMQKNPTTVEIGCLVCVKPIRARAPTIAECVKKWNASEFVK